MNKTTRICSAHFVGGKRKHLSDVPDLFPWTPATRKQPPSRNQPPPPPPPRKVPPPACEALLQPSPSPSPLPSESLQLSTSPSIPLRQSPPNPQSADTTSFEGHTRGPKHDHTYCISATQSKLSATSADDRVLHSNTSRALGAASLMMVSTSVQCSLAGKAFSISLISDEKNAVHFYQTMKHFWLALTSLALRLPTYSIGTVVKPLLLKPITKVHHGP